MNNEFRKLEDKHRARFPAYLCQLESFLSGRHLSKLLRMVAGGSEAQNGLLRQRLAEPSTTESEQLLICELVAASIGQGLSSPGWNISIEGWLYESQFQSDSRLCLAASSYLRDLCNTIRDQENKVGERGDVWIFVFLKGVGGLRNACFWCASFLRLHQTWILRMNPTSISMRAPGDSYTVH